MHESKFYKTKDARLCPVLFYIPGGWINIMPRCELINIEDFKKLKLECFYPVKYDGYSVECDGAWDVPVEDKIDSFGYYNNKIVAIDYGS
jgi:hypothetical protein